MNITKDQIIKFAKKYIRDKAVKEAFVMVVKTDRNEGHSARIITEGLCWKHPRSKRFSELDTMVMTYYNFG